MPKTNNILLVGGAACLSEVVTVPANTLYTTSIPYGMVKNVWGDIPNTGAEIVANGTVDPTNVSTLDANLINNNYTDLVYHNSSTGSANKELPGIDLGSSQPISQAHIYWWNNTYTASDWNLQGSNDGTTWIDISTGLDSTGVVGTSANPQIVTVGASYQYLRVFCVTGNNVTWCVISELEAFDVGVGSTKINLLEENEITIGTDGVNLTIDNTMSIDIDVEINYLK